MPPRLTFDPGIQQLLATALEMDDLDPNHPLRPHVLQPSQLSCVHCQVHLPQVDIQTTALLDTGANPRDYADLHWVEQHREVLTPYLSPCNTPVTLGDHFTVLPCRELLTLEIVIRDDHGVAHSGEVKFLVFDQHGGNQLVIGLETIISSFSQLLASILLEAARGRPDIHHSLMTDDRTLYPWSHPPLEVAPEELDGEPVDPDAEICAHCNMTLAEADAQYETERRARVSDQMKA